MSPRRVVLSPSLAVVLTIGLAARAQDATPPAPRQPATAELSHVEFFDWMFYHNAGWKALAMGENDRAEYLFNKAIEVARAEAATDARLMARSYADLAWVLHRQGRDADAEPLASWALGVREKAFGADAVQVAQTVYTLGAIEVNLGKLDEAEALMARALAICERTSGPESLGAADARVDLATVLALRRSYDRARPLLDRALTTYRRLGADHPGQLAALELLTTLDLKQGRLAEAEARIEEALAILEGDPLADPAFQAATIRRKVEVLRKAGRTDDVPRLEDLAETVAARRRVYPRPPARNELVNDDPRGGWPGTTRRKPAASDSRVGAPR